MDERAPQFDFQFHHISEDQRTNVLGSHALAAFQIVGAGGGNTTEFEETVDRKKGEITESVNKHN